MYVFVNAAAFMHTTVPHRSERGPSVRQNSVLEHIRTKPGTDSLDHNQCHNGQNRRTTGKRNPEPKLHRTDHFFLCGAARSDMLITTPCLLMWEDRHAGSAPTEADQRTRDTDLAAAHSIAYHMRLNITPCITHVRVNRDT